VPSAYIYGSPPSDGQPSGSTGTIGELGTITVDEKDDSNDKLKTNDSKFDTNQNNYRSNATTSSRLDFSLQDESLWGWDQTFNPSINVSGGEQKEHDFGWLGKASTGWEYKLEAFFSPGTFDVDFPALFEIDYPNEAQPGSTLAVNFNSTLEQDGKLNTELGASLAAGAKVFLEYDPKLWGGIGKLSWDYGPEIDLNELLLKKSPVVVDVGLAASTNLIKNNSLQATDTAFQYIDAPNSIAAVTEIATQGVISASTTRKALEKTKLSAKIGGNIKQDSFLEIKSFEIDFDGQDNGNEIIIQPNGSGVLNIPILDDYGSGSTYKFAPTVKPIVDFWSEFRINGKSEASVDLRSFNSRLPKVTLFEGETPYSNPWKTNKFNPFNKATSLPEISIEII
jgi:hypothetical protein